MQQLDAQAAPPSQITEKALMNIVGPYLYEQS
jgi:hypothetical protein